MVSDEHTVRQEKRQVETYGDGLKSSKKSKFVLPAFFN